MKLKVLLAMLVCILLPAQIALAAKGDDQPAPTTAKTQPTAAAAKPVCETQTVDSAGRPIKNTCCTQQADGTYRTDDGTACTCETQADGTIRCTPNTATTPPATDPGNNTPPPTDNTPIPDTASPGTELEEPVLPKETTVPDADLNVAPDEEPNKDVNPKPVVKFKTFSAINPEMPVVGPTTTEQKAAIKKIKFDEINPKELTNSKAQKLDNPIFPWLSGVELALLLLIPLALAILFIYLTFHRPTPVE
jgi:hypothetical protein